MITIPSIHAAATRGDLAAAQALLAATPTLANARDEHGWVPLFHAGHHGHQAVVELLLAYGADATIDRGQVLHYTMQRRHKDIMEVLIAHGAFDAYVRPPDKRIRDLFLVIFRAQSDRLMAMLRHDPDLIHTRGHAGWTLLHYAAEHGDLSIAEVLLAHGGEALIQERDEGGSTPLCRAVTWLHLDVVRLLRAHGADIAVDCFGKTPVEWLQWSLEQRWLKDARMRDEIKSLLGKMMADPPPRR